MDAHIEKDKLCKPIKSINKDSVHKICSGQVILNLATAVKELVENSLDAGASFIEVRLKEYGSESVEVIDNGSGVEESNLEGLTLKHHTSKLQEFEGLTSVETFGFRGEALSSLCALSEMTIVTRHRTADCGTKLQFDYRGHIKHKQPCARQVGTTVTLHNLFSPLPVRQKEFQRNLHREFAKMQQLLFAYCLVCIGIKITCSNVTKKGSRKVVVSTHGSSSVPDNIACVFGAKQRQSIMQLAQKSPSEALLQESGFSTPYNNNLFELEGYVSSCDHGSGRSTTDRQFFYINSRPCEPAKIIKVVNEVYHQFNQNQYPFVFLNIKTARNEVDINVTPDKRQIFLENERALLLIIKASLLHLYESIPSTLKYRNISLSAPPAPALTPSGSLSAMFRQWSKSPSDVGTPVTSQGVKRTAYPETDDTRSRKVLCLTKFFVRTPKSTVTPASDGDSSRSVPVELVALADNGGSPVDSETKAVNTGVNVNVSLSSCLPVEAVDSKSELSQVIDIDSSAVDKSVTADCESLLVEAIDIDKSVTADCESLPVEAIASKSELSQVIDIDSSAVDKSVTADCDSLSVEAIDIDKSVTADSASLLVDSNNEVLQVLVETVTDSEFCTANEECGSVTLQVTMNDIRERIMRQRKRQLTETAEVRVKFRAEINPSKNKMAEEELSKEVTKEMFAKMDILGQFNLGFIITRLGPDLFIIDQHATDEIYNFEILQRDTVIQNQKLVIPQTLELTAANESILIENEEIFRRNGFDFTVDETGEPMKRVKLHTIPVSRNWHFGKEDIDELLFMLQDAPHTMCRPSRVRAMFASRACRKSVMIGTALSKCDMRRLVDHMGELERPWNCPHGRPTMRHLVNLDLLRLGERPYFA